MSWSLISAAWCLLSTAWSRLATAWSRLATAWSLLATAWSLLATAWSLLASAFLGALVLLRQGPAPRRGAVGLEISGLFQDLIRYGKTKRGCGQLPEWLRLLQVPKRWGTEERAGCERSYRIRVFHIGTRA